MATGKADPQAEDSLASLESAGAQPSQSAMDDVVAGLLGRRPQGRYAVAVSRADGMPVVLVNEPFLDSGRPMPTRYWLIDLALNKAIGKLESIGGVKTAESFVDPQALQAAHDRYRRERDSVIDEDHQGPRPSAGVGGTRQGVKCLHAHYGYYLAGGDDPVGEWVDQQLIQSEDALSDLVVHHRALSDDDLPPAVSTTAPVTEPATQTEGSGSEALVELGSGAIKVLRNTSSGAVRERHPTDMLAETNNQGLLSDIGREKLQAGLEAVRKVVGPAASIRVVGTEALRQRPDAEAFELVRDLLGCEVEVLDGEREAALGFHAASRSATRGEPSMASVTIDIGYGSTELATTGPDGDLCVMSLPIGAGTVTSLYLQSDPPRADELSAALSVIELHLDDVRREEPRLAQALADEQVEVLGLGAIRFVSEVELGSNDGDEIDGYRLDHRAVEEVFRTLATESSADRAANPGLRAEHVSWIVGAMCILVETMRQFGIDHIHTSTLGILDGLLMEEQPVDQFAEIDGPKGSGN